MVKQFDYEALQADAQDLPLQSGFADLVIVNASIHHCDDMAQALKEAARLVAPGGMLVIDHDPQLSAWDFRGLGLLLWKSRLWIYRFTKKKDSIAPTMSKVSHSPAKYIMRPVMESRRSL